MTHQKWGSLDAILEAGCPLGGCYHRDKLKWCHTVTSITITIIFAMHTHSLLGKMHTYT